MKAFLCAQLRGYAVKRAERWRAYRRTMHGAWPAFLSNADDLLARCLQAAKSLLLSVCGYLLDKEVSVMRPPRRKRRNTSTYTFYLPQGIDRESLQQNSLYKPHPESICRLGSASVTARTLDASQTFYLEVAR